MDICLVVCSGQENGRRCDLLGCCWTNGATLKISSLREHIASCRSNNKRLKRNLFPQNVINWLAWLRRKPGQENVKTRLPSTFKRFFKGKQGFLREVYTHEMYLERRNRWFDRRKISEIIIFQCLRILFLFPLFTLIPIISSLNLNVSSMASLFGSPPGTTIQAKLLSISCLRCVNAVWFF